MIRGGARITTERRGHADPPRCPVCACLTHSFARTWEVTCAACGELRWPYRVDPPLEGWECARCRNTTPEERQRRQDAAARAMVTREIRAAMRAVNDRAGGEDDEQDELPMGDP